MLRTLCHHYGNTVCHRIHFAMLPLVMQLLSMPLSRQVEIHLVTGLIQRQGDTLLHHRANKSMEVTTVKEVGHILHRPRGKEVVPIPHHPPENTTIKDGEDTIRPCHHLPLLPTLRHRTLSIQPLPKPGLVIPMRTFQKCTTKISGRVSRLNINLMSLLCTPVTTESHHIKTNRIFQSPRLQSE